MTALEPGVMKVMRVHSALIALPLIVIAAVLELILFPVIKVPNGLVIVPVLGIALYIILRSPARRYHAWGYEIGDQELVTQHGVWTQVQTCVPFGRVQHIDVSQGPIERRYDVYQLVLHTAGTEDTLVTLPGLSRETAENLRDTIRAYIRQETP